jgi:NAD(P)-dependent dehydrogenase (short-subunit alcohol dehydrogenase family)
MHLGGKNVVVTGGASGIGKAMCERFHLEGAARVMVVDRNAEAAAAVAESIAGTAYPCDLGNEAEVTAMIREAEASLGRIDVLCNNAGIANDEDFLEGSADAWDLQWRVNVMSHVHAVRAALPAMLERGEGSVQHTASMAGILTSHGAAAYASTKHAVVGLAEWLSITYHERGVRFFLLAPLGVDTPMLDTSSDFARNAAGPIKTADEVAGYVVDAFAEERFLILTDPIAREWMHRKDEDLERWLGGMRRLQRRLGDRPTDTEVLPGSRGQPPWRRRSRRPRRSASQSRITRPRASPMMPLFSFDSPATRSLNVIGNSTIRPPMPTSRCVISTWKP